MGWVLYVGRLYTLSHLMFKSRTPAHFAARRTKNLRALIN
jgi:hypothetical protein